MSRENEELKREIDEEKKKTEQLERGTEMIGKIWTTSYCPYYNFTNIQPS